MVLCEKEIESTMALACNRLYNGKRTRLCLWKTQRYRFKKTSTLIHCQFIYIIILLVLFPQILSHLFQVLQDNE